MDLVNVLTQHCQGILGAEGVNTKDALFQIIHYVYLGIQVVVPILLIIFGMIELAKAITSQKDDEIKKAQSGLFKKFILAVIVFLVFTLVSILMSIVGKNDDKQTDGASETVWQCAKAIINAD